MRLNVRLASLRENRGYSTRELAEMLGVSQSSVSLWEKGERKPDYDKIIKLADIYGVSTDYLLGNDADANIIPEYAMLNEVRNELLSQLSITEMECKKTSEKMTELIKELDLDRDYFHRKEESFKTSDFKNDIQKDEERLLSLIERSMDNKKMKLNVLKKDYISLKDKISETEKTLNKINQQFNYLKKQEEHILDNIDKIEKSNFNNIEITSEFEMQILIFKYLDVYEIYKKSNMSPTKFMKMISNRFSNIDWKKTVNINKSIKPAK